MSTVFSVSERLFSGSVFLDLLQLAEYLIVFGKTACRYFGEEEASVRLDLKSSAARFDEIDIRETVLLQKVGQTGRLRKIESRNAVFDGNVHGTLGFTIDRCYGIPMTYFVGRLRRTCRMP
jgi:hypothetical protein